ncbi:MAG: hypothetical protein ACOH1T_10430 [Microbacteriaceae bacterium]
MKRLSLRTGIVMLASTCALATVASYVVVAANTVSTTVGVSRMAPYSSVKEMRDASAIVVVATVTGARDFSDQGITSTEYELTVTTQQRQNDIETSTADQISVIQDGRPGEVEADEDFLMREGSTYLLFLIDSNAANTMHRPYYVTGVWAGIYHSDGDDRFVQVMKRADRLPPSLTLREALG